jgi:hypothetical protein
MRHKMKEERAKDKHALYDRRRKYLHVYVYRYLYLYVYIYIYSCEQSRVGIDSDDNNTMKDRRYTRKEKVPSLSLDHVYFFFKIATTKSIRFCVEISWSMMHHRRQHSIVEDHTILVYKWLCIR